MAVYVDAQNLIKKIQNMKSQYGKRTRVNAQSMLNVVVAMIRETQEEEKVAIHLNTYEDRYEIEYNDGTTKRVYHDGRTEWF